VGFSVLSSCPPFSPVKRISLQNYLLFWLEYGIFPLQIEGTNLSRIVIVSGELLGAPLARRSAREEMKYGDT